MSRTPDSTTVLSDHDTEEPAHRFLGLSPAQIAGGALAAVTAALAASFFGVGGTLIGAALGSVISTVGGALYSESFGQAHRTIQSTRVRLVRSTASSATGHVAMDDPANLPPDLDDEASVVAEAPSGLPVEAPKGRALNVKVLAAVAGVFFVIAVGAITVTELFLGHPVSNASQSGTSISQVAGGGSGDTRTPTPTPTSSSNPSGSASDQPSVVPTDSAAPSASPSASPDGASPPASDAASPSPTDAAPAVPVPSGAPSAGAPVAPSDAAPGAGAPTP